MVELAKRAAERSVGDKAQFIQAHLPTDVQQGDRAHAVPLPSLNIKLRPTIPQHAPGTRVVSPRFTMDDWQADQVDSSKGAPLTCGSCRRKSGGMWKIDVAGGGMRSYEATFTSIPEHRRQRPRERKVVTFTNGKLRGDASRSRSRTARSASSAAAWWATGWKAPSRRRQRHEMDRDATSRARREVTPYLSAGWLRNATGRIRR